MTPDSLPWHGPDCPQCGRELDVETLASSTGLTVVYMCRKHGVMALETDLFGNPSEPDSAPESPL